MTKNEHVYATCCQSEVGDDVISAWNVRTIQSYLVVDFVVASSSSFRDSKNEGFCDDKVGDGSGGVNAICRRPEVPDDVICGEDAATFREYGSINVFVASFSNLRENRNQSLM